MQNDKEYTIPATCHVCSKKFLARFNVGDRAKVCTKPSHKCKMTIQIVNGREKRISCPEKCCRDRYRRASAAMAGSQIDSRKFLSDGEYKKTLAAICGLGDLGLKMALWFILETGCRLGETLLVRRNHLDWRDGKLSVVAIPTEKKVGHPALPVHMENGTPFARALRKWSDAIPAAGALFTVGRRTIQRAFERILDKVKPDRASLIHILRHTRASRLTESGMDPNTIRGELRWSSIELLKVYSHTTEEKISKAFRRMR